MPSRPPRTRPRRSPDDARSQVYSPVPQSPHSRASSTPFSPRRKPVPPLPPGSETSSSFYGAASSSYSISRSIANGQIGGNYGPYSYNPSDEMARNPNRFSAESSSSSGHSSSGSVVYEKPVPPLPPPPTTPATPVRELSEKTLTQFTTTTTTMPQYIWNKDPEVDDSLHNPHYKESWFSRFTLCSARGWPNVVALLAIVAGLLTMFFVYPIIEFVVKPQAKITGYNLGGINASGQVPEFSSFPSLIDPDTPEDARTRTGSDGKKYNLVFSDEFNVDDRTFYPGDDPYWEAADLHYWTTNDLEYYDPQAITTRDGKLVITMTQQKIHGLDYMSGMMTSWNKLCFTTGYVEVSVSLPGTPTGAGFWPGAWTMGNLGRPGYGASTEGMWPYSYDSCDLGTFPNQTTKDGQPEAAKTGGNGGGSLSYQPGQRTSACTCSGEDHPGPRNSKGRGVPEIDILEAQIDTSVGQGEASQSYQIAPYNMNYYFANTTPATTIYDASKTKLNTYLGAVYQQALSAVTYIDKDAYAGKAYSTYGYEWYSNPKHRDDGYITWYYNGGETWQLTTASLAADPNSQVSQRLIPEEPMYMILNFGMATGFQKQDFANLQFPAQMFVDYVRVYQRQGTKDGLTCDPPDYPTKDYIDRHINAYMNPNLTTWQQAGYTFPKNSEYDGC